MVVRDRVGNQIFRSATQDNVLDPVFQFSINWAADEVYTIEIRDNDPMNPDDSLGTIALPAANLVGVHNLANPSGGTLQIFQLSQ